VKAQHLVGVLHTPILDDYEFKAMVGKGAFGTVSIAEHRKLKVTRAIKKIPKQMVDTEETAIASQNKEFEVLREIDHPHILRVYQMYEDDLACYIVTELLEGGELYEQIYEQDFFEESHAKSIAFQIVTALSALHAANVVHRDIKPENILLHSQHGEPLIKICDFGFACKQPKEGMKEAIGTPYYVAPEVLSGSRYDKKCDVWSVGVVTFVMLSGRTPFNAKDLVGIAREIRNCNYTFDYPEFTEVSEEAKNFIRTCLQVNPEARESMAGLLTHPWLKRLSCKHDSTPSVPTKKKDGLAQNLKNYSTADKFQQGIITFICVSIGMRDEMHALGKLFASLDSSGDGKLSVTELKEGLHKVFGLDNTTFEAEAVMEAMDADGDGQIDYTEFLSATSDHTNLLTEKNLSRVFQYMDVNDDGTVSFSELIGKLDAAGVSKRSESLWAEIMLQADQNGDDQLSETEFVDIMKRFTTAPQSPKIAVNK